MERKYAIGKLYAFYTEPNLDLKPGVLFSTQKNLVFCFRPFSPWKEQRQKQKFIPSPPSKPNIETRKICNTKVQINLYIKRNLQIPNLN